MKQGAEQAQRFPRYSRMCLMPRVFSLGKGHDAACQHIKNRL